MSIKVTLSDWKVPAKLTAIANDSGLGSYAAEEMGRGMAEYVPAETGVLSQLYATTPYHVLYLAVYARRQYYGEGFNFSKEVHPNATAKWADAYRVAKGRELSQVLQGYVNRM